MNSTYTLKFYLGRKLIAEQSWDGNEVLLDEITHDAENAIEEAVQCNPPKPKAQEKKA